MGKRTVTVTGTGRANVAPDVVRLDLRVGHDAPDVAAALSGASAGITAVGAVVREQGVADADLRTLDASVNQRWDNTGVAVGFTAQQRLAVTVRELDAVGRILESAAGGGRQRAPRRPGAPRRLGPLARGSARHATPPSPTPGPRRSSMPPSPARRWARCSGWPRAAQRPCGGGFKLAAMARDMAGGMPVEGGDLELAASVTVTWELGRLRETREPRRRQPAWNSLRGAIVGSDMATTDLTAQSFEKTVLDNDIVLVDFWASWCGPCRQFAPIYDSASQSGDNEGIVFGKVDTEAEQSLAQAANITSIPTLMAFKEGVLVFAQPGALPQSALQDVIEQVKALDMAPIKEQMAAEGATGPAQA